jgi:5-methylcytosine-specific restriction protein A
MSKLLRPCLDCGRTVRGKTRCGDCQRARDGAKRAKRPRFKSYQEAERRRRAVAEHRASVGDWCPGWQHHPAHPSADLTADHAAEVAAGGREDGALVVRCRSCNAARSANVRDALLAQLVGTPRQPESATLFAAAVDDGPTVA